MGTSEIILVLLSFVGFPLMFFLVFLVIRKVMPWYWKVDKLIKNQEFQNQALHHQNEVLKQQVDLLKIIATKTDAHSGN